MYTRLEANGTYNLYPHNGLEPLAKDIVPDVLALFDPEALAELEKENAELEDQVALLMGEVEELKDLNRGISETL